MPGPLSTPNGWNEKERWNHTVDHGVVGAGPRRSGKTYWDKAHGKWANRLANRSRRADENQHGPQPGGKRAR